MAVGRNHLVAAVGAFDVAVEPDSENVCRTKGYKETESQFSKICDVSPGCLVTTLHVS